MRIIMPQIGQSIAEATIVKWFKQPGERIEKGEILVEIGTDKINTEIPAPETGVIESLLVPEGETVPIQTEIAVLREEGVPDLRAAGSRAGETPVALPRAADSEVHPAEGLVDTRAEGATRAGSSPYVRRMAQEYGINLEDLAGSGSGGRVTKDDILRAIASGTVAPARATEERIPMSRMRKLIAGHMALSRRTAADVTTVFEVDMTEVSSRRDKAKEIYRDRYSVKLTYLPFIVAAVVKAIQAFPVLNSSVDGEAIIYKKEINIGVAVALEDGLVVPVLKNADGKNILGLARAMQELSDRAKNKRLLPEDLEGGTFSITNPGVFGALMGTPIIHQPQVAILGVGAVVKRPVVVDDDAVAVRSMMYLSLSYDHRALDGATADRFLAHIKHTLEEECPSPLE